MNDKYYEYEYDGDYGHNDYMDLPFVYHDVRSLQLSVILTVCDVRENTHGCRNESFANLSVGLPPALCRC